MERMYLSGRIVAPPNKAGREKLTERFFLSNLVDAGTVAAYPDNVGTDFAQRHECMALVLLLLIVDAQERMPLLGTMLIQADAVVGGIP